MSSSMPLHTFNYSDFTDIKELGKGEFGIVFMAKHHQFQKLAVRVISRRYFARKEEQDALRKEAEKLFFMVSEQVIRLLGVVMEPEHLCLVFEYAEYGSLDKVLMRCNVPVPWPLKIRIAYEISLGMCFLHDKNVLHLRLKCRNILVAGNIHAKICDICFTQNGQMNTWTRLANVYSQSVNQSSSGSSGSSIAHVPPELIRNVNASPEKTTDVYAYGIILWQILTDKAPYEGKNPEEICNSVVAGIRPADSLIPQDRPDVLYKLMCGCWEDEKENRPSFSQVCNEMKQTYDENETSARNLALDCQKDIADFCFPQNVNLGAPEGDLCPVTRNTGARGDVVTRPKSSADGVALRVSAGDKRVVKGNPRPDLKAIATPTGQQSVQGRTTETNIPEEDKDGPTQHFYPAENSSRIATTEDLYKVAEELGNRWRQFGRSLGFSDGQLDNIELNYERNGYPEIPYQMLRRWKDGELQITVGYLVKILKTNGQLHIAAKMDP